MRDSAGIEIVENQRPAWAPGGEWRLDSVPTLRIGVVEGDPAYQLFRVNGALRLDDGTIAVSNSGTDELRFYDSSGTHLRTVGGDGEGPGEYRFIQRFAHFAPDSLGVWDPTLGRGTVLGEDGSLGRYFRAPDRGDAFLYFYGFAGDGTVILTISQGLGLDTAATGVQRHHAAYSRFDTEERLDTIGTFFSNENFISTVNGRMSMSDRTFSPRAVVGAAHGHFFHGTGETFEIRKLTLEGELVRIIRGSHELVPVTSELIEANRARTVERISDPARRRDVADRLAVMDYPETLPAYQDLLIDRVGNLWVADFRLPEDDQPRWTVFDAAGRELGKLETPVGLEIFEIGADYVLGRERDELGVERVVLYGLEKEGR